MTARSTRMEVLLRFSEGSRQAGKNPNLAAFCVLLSSSIFESSIINQKASN